MFSKSCLLSFFVMVIATVPEPIPPSLRLGDIPAGQLSALSRASKSDAHSQGAPKEVICSTIS